MNNMLNELEKLFGEFSTSDVNSKYDLSKEEDYNKVMDICNELKDNDLAKLMCKFLGFDLDNIITEIKNVHEKSVAEKKKIEDPKKVQLDLQIHHLVQEYIDEIDKKMSDTKDKQKVLNNAYVGFYDFAQWLMKHE